MKQKQKTCNLRRHRDQPVVGVCLEDHCKIDPYVCQKCILQRHKGHLVLAFKYLQIMKEEAPNEKITQSASKIAVQNVYNSLSKVCQNLFATSSAKMEEEFKNKEPFLNMINSNLQSVQIKQIIRQIITQKDIPQQAMTQYMNVLRTYYLEGGYSKLHIPTNKQKIENGIKKLVQESQKQIEVIIKNLATKIIKYQQNEAIEEPQVKEENLGEESPIFFKRHPKSQIIDVNKTLLNHSQKNKQILLKYNLFRNASCQSERMKKIIIRETKQVKVNQLIYCIDVNQVEELTIINSGTICAVDEEAVKQIAKMTKLKRLRIFWARGMQAEQVIMMTKYMTDLEELCLCELDTCSTQLVHILQINNPKLHKIVFSIDLKHFVRYNEENLQFMLDCTYFYTSEDFWITLTSGLRNLSNVQLNFPQNITYWANFLEQNKKNLRQFTLMACKGRIQKCKQYKAETQDKSELIKALQKCTNLQCLRLQQVTFKDKNLLQVVKNNKKLISLVLCECPSIKNETYRNILRIRPQLQELSIQIDDSFTGSALSTLTSLKTLVLRCCWEVNQEIFIQNLPILRNLKCLVIDFNHYWITGQTISVLQTLQNLKILNISNNNLTASDIRPLRRLSILNTLICYNNWFSYTELFKLPYAKLLKKLSIGKNTNLYPNDDQYEMINMKDLVLNFPALTHLKLNGFSGIQPEYFELMNRLICVTVINAPCREIILTKKYCEQSKIYFNNYEEDEMEQEQVKQQKKEEEMEQSS